jgi:hypothetical protein
MKKSPTVQIDILMIAYGSILLLCFDRDSRWHSRAARLSIKSHTTRHTYGGYNPLTAWCLEVCL